MQLSKKLKKFLCNFIAFFKSTLNFDYFEKNESSNLRIYEIIDSKRRGYLNVLAVLFLKTLLQTNCYYVSKNEI